MTAGKHIIILLSNVLLWPVGISNTYYTVALLLKSNYLFFQSNGRLEEENQLFRRQSFEDPNKEAPDF